MVESMCLAPSLVGAERRADLVGYVEARWTGSVCVHTDYLLLLHRCSPLTLINASNALS